MRTSPIVFVAAVVAAGACGRTESGDVIIRRPTSVNVKTTLDTIRVKTKVETVNAPAVVGTKKETVIVDKPVFGTKKTVIKVPVVDK